MYSGRRDVALEEARHSRRASPDWPLDDDLSRGTFRCDCAVDGNHLGARPCDSVSHALQQIASQWKGLSPHQEDSHSPVWESDSRTLNLTGRRRQVWETRLPRLAAGLFFGPPALLTLARVRLQRLSPIGNRRNPPAAAENAPNFFSSNTRAARGPEARYVGLSFFPRAQRGRWLGRGAVN